MSKIRVEKKNDGTSILPWILGILIAALAIWGIVEASEETDEALSDSTYETVESPYDRANEINDEPMVVETMLIFANEQEGNRFIALANDYESYTADMTGELGLDHEFSHAALMKLKETTEALVAAYGMSGGESMQQSMKDIEMAADVITKNPYATNHADMIRKAALGITDMLDEVQNAKYPAYNDAIEDLRKAAMDISKETLTLDQKEDVRTFFRNARTAIQAMRKEAL